MFVPDLDEAGVVRGYVAHIVDISERKKAEEALCRSNLLLEESNRQLVEALNNLSRTQKQVILQEKLRALGEMASGITHDFNNALMPILGFSEILLQHPDYLADSEKAKRYLNLILTAGQGAARTVERLREFYRNRGDEEVFSPVALDRLIDQAIDLTEPKWKNEALMKGSEIEIKTFPSPVPTFMGEEADLREALVNLIFNAVDAMPKGGTLSIGARREKEEIILSVNDTGIGMSEEIKEKCLEPFFTTKAKEGTGLGLAMVHGIVNRHGGKIEIVSSEGCGTTIQLRFPISAEV